MVRAQYHFRLSDQGLLAWDVRGLIELSADLENKLVQVSAIAELDENHWYAHAGQIPTCRSIIDHVNLIEQADLSYPIILCAEGRVMDGMHRVCKATLLGQSDIWAVQFPETPKPDYVGLQPGELPYN